MLDTLPIIPTLIVSASALVALAIFAPGLLAIAGLTFFVAIIAWHVPSPDLIIILAVVIAMASYDFLREYLGKHGGDKK